MATLAKPKKCEYKRKTQVSSPTVSQNWRLCWGKLLEVGLPYGLDHLYFQLIALFALHLWALYRSFIDPNPDLGKLFLGSNKTVRELCGVYRHG